MATFDELLGGELKRLLCCDELELFGHKQSCEHYKSAQRVIPAKQKKQRNAAAISTATDACIYCGTRTRKGSLDLDGQCAHRTCYERANND